MDVQDLGPTPASREEHGGGEEERGQLLHCTTEMAARLFKIGRQRGLTRSPFRSLGAQAVACWR